MEKLKFTARYRMKDIPNSDAFMKIELIHKGWSGDKKYYIETIDGERLLLRISDISFYEENDVSLKL